jgi:hypothetical protein
VDAVHEIVAPVALIPEADSPVGTDGGIVSLTPLCRLTISCALNARPKICASSSFPPK